MTEKIQHKYIAAAIKDKTLPDNADFRPASSSTTGVTTGKVR
jgi:hypothetical protein